MPKETKDKNKDKDKYKYKDKYRDKYKYKDKYVRRQVQRLTSVPGRIFLDRPKSISLIIRELSPKSITFSGWIERRMSGKKKKTSVTS